ncbi:MAG: MarR family transcriptional regulator [Clostridia bacterium]
METNVSVRLVNSMKHLMWHLRKIDTEVISKYGLSFNEYRVFQTIAYRKSINPKVLTEKHKIYYSNMTGIIDKLVKNGFVIRKRDESDRRMVNIELSSKGRAIKEEIEKEIEKRITEYCRNLPEDRLEKASLAIEEILEVIEEETR